MRRPNLDMGIFKARRDRIKKLLSHSALIIPAHPEFPRNSDVHHPYRQDSNLFYLSGFDEPESVLVLRPGQTPEYVLFVRPRDPMRETWDGFRYGPEGAEREFGVDKAYPSGDLDRVLPTLLKDVDKVYYRMMYDREFDKKLATALESTRTSWGRSGRGLLPLHDSSELLGELRLRKTAEEVQWLRTACEISAQGHVAAMRFTRPGVTELQVQGLVQHQFRSKGSPRDGYTPIVASGANATILHYVFNDQTCKEGELLLIDAGAEYNYYTGDITRTFPVSGKFTDSQKSFYEKVLHVQKELLAMVRPGTLFQKFQDMTTELLTEAMLDLGLLKGVKERILEEGTQKRYYPHSVSHWLGMDVHDIGLYKKDGKSRIIEPGMSFTIEPGLYVPAEDESAPKEFRGLGVRIEDDVLVTDNGCEVLTSAAPKSVSDLENMVGQG